MSAAHKVTDQYVAGVISGNVGEVIAERERAFTWPDLAALAAVLDVPMSRLLREECHDMRPHEVGAYLARSRGLAD